jgi:ABC-type branched-subunit amino acid transport system permease subunit
VLGDYQMMIYGVFIVIILLFMPKGVVGALEMLMAKFKDKEREQNHA